MDIFGIELIEVASDYLSGNITSPGHQEAISELRSFYDLPIHPNENERSELVKIVNKYQSENNKKTRIDTNGKIYDYKTKNNYVVFMDDTNIRGGKKSHRKRGKSKRKMRSRKVRKSKTRTYKK